MSALELTETVQKRRGNCSRLKKWRTGKKKRSYGGVIPREGRVSGKESVESRKLVGGREEEKRRFITKTRGNCPARRGPTEFLPRRGRGTRPPFGGVSSELEKSKGR